MYRHNRLIGLIALLMYGEFLAAQNAALQTNQNPNSSPGIRSDQQSANSTYRSVKGASDEATANSSVLVPYSYACQDRGYGRNFLGRLAAWITYRPESSYVPKDGVVNQPNVNNPPTNQLTINQATMKQTWINQPTVNSQTTIQPTINQTTMNQPRIIQPTPAANTNIAPVCCKQNCHTAPCTQDCSQERCSFGISISRPRVSVERGCVASRENGARVCSAGNGSYPARACDSSYRCGPLPQSNCEINCNLANVACQTTRCNSAASAGKCGLNRHGSCAADGQCGGNPISNVPPGANHIDLNHMPVLPPDQNRQVVPDGKPVPSPTQPGLWKPSPAQPPIPAPPTPAPAESKPK